MIINFDDCVVPVSKILGEEHRGFDAANEWLGSTRLQVAAVCVGRGSARSAAAATARTTGRLTQKIHRHDRSSVNSPPSSGPSDMKMAATVVCRMVVIAT